MKNRLFILMVFYFGGNVLFAQNNLTNISQDSPDQNIANPEIFNNPKEYFEKYNSTTQLLYNKKDTYWVHDSTYNYNGFGSEWELGYRERFISSELSGDTSISIYMRHSWNEANQSWINKDTIVSKGNDSGYQNIEWPWNSQSQEWADTSRFYSFDENYNTILFVYKNWDYAINEFNWGFKDVFTYDDNGIKTNKLEYNLDLGMNAWVNNSFYTFTYDENENMIQTLVEQWDAVENDWVNFRLILFTYDEYDNQTQQLEQNWDVGLNDWANGGLWMDSYNENNLKIEQLFQYWDFGNDDWLNSSISFYTYDEEWKLTQVFNQQWNIDNEDWVDNYINTYTYNNNESLLHLFSQYWNDELSQWINSSQSLYHYNEAGIQTQVFSQTWDELISEWKNGWKYDYFWSEHEISNIDQTQNATINIYPNPASNKIILSGNIPFENEIVLMFNSIGRLIKTTQLNFQNEIDISDLQKGIYIIQIQTSNRNIIRKLIKN